MVGKLSYYMQKIMCIGIRNVIKICYMRVRSTCMDTYWRYQVLEGKQISKWHNGAYNIFFECLQSKNLPYIKSLYDTEISKEQFIEKAQWYTNNEFCFLGSYRQRYDQIPWHVDFRLQQQNNVADVIFDKISFYRDLRIQQGTKDTLSKDIKVPWELSRFQYLYILGKAYEYTKQQCYIDAFQRYVTDWLDNNSYLCGINWQCPMEVGIRAINWIVAWEFFKNDPNIPLNFSERFACSLYDHMTYLENNWEYYDSRTNNHYLSNLVAYLYLCWFFNDLPGVQKKRVWVVQEILSEFEKQVFPEGTSYEGSTNYHCFVTELFYHAYLLFKEMNIQVPEHFQSTLSRMFDFISWCTIDNKILCSIGDNDSGKLLYYGLTRNIIMQMQTSLISIPLIRQKKVAYFSHFGLSIVKTNDWHVTLRHHTYNALQPSGHFHNDVGSITLAVGGIPVIIDPGSFVYTPSAIWRNYFRSAAIHNTSFISGIEPIPLHDELFVLHVPERFICESPRVDNDSMSLHMSHSLYEHLSVQFMRRLEVNDNCMVINDIWIGGNESQKLTSDWNFTLSPGIIAIHCDNGWLLKHQQTPLVIIRSYNVILTIHEVWISCIYGQKVATQSLRASRVLDNQNVIIECIRV